MLHYNSEYDSLYITHLIQNLPIFITFILTITGIIASFIKKLN